MVCTEYILAVISIDIIEKIYFYKIFKTYVNNWTSLVNSQPNLFWLVGKLLIILKKLLKRVI